MMDITALAINLYLVGGTLVGFLILIAATIYDIQYEREKKRTNSKVKKPTSKKSHVTVLVYVDASKHLARCLQHLFKSRYKNFDVVVIDNYSPAPNRVHIRAAVHNLPRPNLRLYQKRKRSNKAEALRLGYSRSKRGNVIVTLDSSQMLSANFLKLIAIETTTNQSKVARMAVSAESPLSVFGLVGSMKSMWLHLVRKSLSVFGNVARIRATTGFIYSPELFKRASSQQKLAWHYDAGIRLEQDYSTISFGEYSLKQKSFYWVVTAISLIFFTVTVWLAATLESSLPLALSWLIVTLWFLCAISIDDQTTFGRKLVLLLCLPIYYFLIHATLIVQPFGALLKNLVPMHGDKNV